MSNFEESLVAVWVFLVSVIYPIFVFKGQARLRERLESLHQKLDLLKYDRPRALDQAKLQTPVPPAPSVSSVEEKMETKPAPSVDAHPAEPLPPPLPPKPPVASAKPPAPVLPVPRQLPPQAPVHKPSGFELAAKGLWSRIWNWILVGEEYRKPGVSVEFAVATNWLVRVGVLVLVVGVGFFLDYSARMGWLGDLGKVSLAGLVGAGLVGGGMFNLNKKYHLLGQGLVGAGLAVLYTTVFAAHQRYELVPPLPAFIGMFLVTLGAAGISLFARSLLIAVLGLIGGYLTPFLLPDSGAVSGLLVYLAVLGLGVLLISTRRQWFVLNFLAFLFTSLHMFAMLEWWRDPVSFGLVMPFVVLYFLIFSTSAFLFQVLQKEKSTWLDLGFLLMNAGTFFLSAQALIVREFPREWVSAVALFLAGFYALHLFVFIKRKGEDRGLALCFLSLMSLFLLLTIPLYFSEDWWTLAWSLLALVLLMGSQKVNSRFMAQVAFGIFTLSLFRFLWIDLEGAYDRVLHPDTPMTTYLSALWERLMKMGVPLASLGGALWLQNHPRNVWPEFQFTDENDSPTFLNSQVTGWIFRAVLLGCGMVVLHLEVSRSFGFLFSAVTPSLLTLVWVAGGWVLLGWTRRYPQSDPLKSLLLFFSAILMVKWFAWDVPDWNFSTVTGRYTPYNFLEAGMRLLDFLIRGGFLLFAYGSFSREKEMAGLRNIFGYTALANLWLYSTFEVNSLLATFVPGLRSGGLSVFWGLFALALVSVGLVKRHRPLRLLGLAQFAWVAVKVFFYDLASLDPIYKIVAFILLGMVLLAGAFVYLRFQDRFALTAAEGEER